MTFEEREQAILRAATPVFAEKGFHGVKTKEIARAAGVSEALVFQHFPTKAALFAAVQRHVHGPEEDSELVAKFLVLPPSTEKLMLGVHLILAHLAEETPPGEKVMPRLMTRSLLDDGDFARQHLARLERDWWPAFADCLRAARKADEAGSVGTPDLLMVWFFHHLGFAVRLLRLPGATVDYGASGAPLVEHLVRFVLRGLGIRQEVIQAKYRPEQLLQRLA